MKLGPVTKLYKRNKTSSKKVDDDFMSEHLCVITNFLIFVQFGAVRRPDPRHRVCKSYVFSNSNLISYKNWKQNLKISNTALTLLLWVKVLFWIKNASFCKSKFVTQQSIKSTIFRTNLKQRIELNQEEGILLVVPLNLTLQC